ncbi:hypothetical protein HMPREF0623_1275 [Pediococcus acidilactici DSM 20284]|uniref:Uncharacterized protein n=1 Tax=Pediococcus acidilactici DSM 20284 TaxID=862514 RepID=E0NG52_PEDAC|nr:hypothetical protein HMPREF0623_1275 [Pediococcus acidilactici DSM 20284]
MKFKKHQQLIIALFLPILKKYDNAGVFLIIRGTSFNSDFYACND